MRNDRPLRHRTCPLLPVLLLCALAAPAAAGPADDKAGSVMVNVKLGASVPIYIKDRSGSALDALPAAFAAQIEGGFALDGDRRAYLVLPVELHVGSRSSGGAFGGASVTFTKLIVPVGFQYDIPIPGVRGLYVYPRASLGYVAYIGNFSGSVLGVGFGSSNTYHGGMFAPELGLKYVWRRLHVGIEPFSLPVHFVAVDRVSGGQEVTVLLDYRLHGYAGVNF
jgi:hypothetical protein